MSLQRAARAARARADKHRRGSQNGAVTPELVEEVKELIHRHPAYIVWLHRRLASELDDFANELEHLADEDVTPGPVGDK